MNTYTIQYRDINRNIIKEYTIEEREETNAESYAYAQLRKCRLHPSTPRVDHIRITDSDNREIFCMFT
jgi:hypothetical protein